MVALGLDAHVDDPFKGLAVTTDGFTRIGRAIAGAGRPVLCVQEGGYVSDAGGQPDRVSGWLEEGADMAEVAYRTLYLKKRFPLAISRGVIEGAENLFVSVTENGVTGWGEVAPGATEGAATPAEAEAMLHDFCAGGIDDAADPRQSGTAPARRAWRPARWPGSTWRCGISRRNRRACRSTACWGWRDGRCRVR